MNRQLKLMNRQIKWEKDIMLPVCVLILCVPAALFLLGPGDALAFMRWYLGIFLLGVGFYPASILIFRRFRDRGWMFSKILGLAFGGYVVWLLGIFHTLAFTSRRSLVVTLILAGLCWSFFLGKGTGEGPDPVSIFREEAVFAILFLLLTWLAGFRPEAYGTEKFMDYGFLVSMMRSVELPPLDIWFGTDPINYYYGGQYYAAYLAKLTWVPASSAYNLMRMMIGAFAFVLPYSLVHQMLREFLDSESRTERGRKSFAVRHRGAMTEAGAVIAGTAVAFAGNVHYVLYGLFGSLLRLPGYETYWFPSSTRYIGHNPLTDDTCIHEFPSYSIILGDLHAHMINIIFVLTVLAVLYTWLMEVRSRYKKQTRLRQKLQEEQRHRPKRFEKQSRFGAALRFTGENLREPHLIIAAVLIGLFCWTNFWDHVIYLTVAMICILFDALYTQWEKPARAVGGIIIHTLLVAGVSRAVSTPFLMSFTTMASEVRLAVHHSALYQLLVLWGLPVGVLVILVPTVLAVCGRKKREQKNVPFFHGAELQDFWAVILGCCALGLILIPELVYVRDIYEDGSARANTMFKLTYQAFILFGIMMGYAFVRLFAALPVTTAVQLTDGRAVERNGGLPRRVFTGFLLAVFVLTCGYFPYAVSCWFGNVFDRSQYEGLDATAFVEYAFPEDASAIRWLNQEVEFQPILLEAYGDSYTGRNVVSAMTGLPTLEGWYVHEWLWRSDTEELNKRISDIDYIYTSDDEEGVRQLLYDYNVSYIYVGSNERDAYPALNHRNLQKMGDIVFEDGPTYIVAVGRE